MDIKGNIRAEINKIDSKKKKLEKKKINETKNCFLGGKIKD